MKIFLINTFFLIYLLSDIGITFFELFKIKSLQKKTNYISLIIRMAKVQTFYKNYFIEP